MDVENLITETYSPIEAPDVYSQLAENRGESIGVVLTGVISARQKEHNEMSINQSVCQQFLAI